MNSQIIRSRVITDTRQPDITLGEKQHVWGRAGDEEVGADIKLLPFQEQRLLNVPARAERDRRHLHVTAAQGDSELTPDPAAPSFLTAEFIALSPF